jgi:hypothetical protein
MKATRFENLREFDSRRLECHEGSTVRGKRMGRLAATFKTGLG